MPPLSFPAGLEQIFRTTPLPNFQTALYTLSIRDANQNEIEGYTFPISPSNVNYEPTAMTNFYDVHGSAQQLGVQRIADLYGSSPPNINLQGTTGWQYHATDGGQFSGLDSIMAVVALLEDFAAYNQIQAQNNQPPYTLEFYDYFSSQFWQIVPVGKQGVSQSAQRPLLFDYAFRFAAIQPLDTAPPNNINDPIAADFSTPATQAQSSLSSSIGTSLEDYSGNTAGGTVTLGNPTFQ